MSYYDYTAIVQRVQQDGTMKAVTEKWLVSDEALMAALEKGEKYLAGDEAISVGCTQTKYAEVFGNPAEHLFKAKVNLITIDEASGKEKRHTVLYAVWADDIAGAEKQVRDTMNQTMCNYVLTDLSETKYIDIIS